MYQVVCTDILGTTHDVPADEMLLRSSANAVVILNDQVLLVQDVVSKLWRFPGGPLYKVESEFEGLKREVMSRTGVVVARPTKLVAILEEDFYNMYTKEAYHATRMFYLVTVVESSIIQPAGDGLEIVAANFFPVKDVLKYNEKTMKKKYQEILKKALEAQKVS